jgi:hypothetical protein
MIRSSVAAVVVTVIGVIGASVAQANDSSFGAAGAPYPRPTPNRDIRMTAETVSVRFLNDTARVSCVFTFRNEGPPQRVVIGFPDEAHGDVPERGLIQWFRSWVNDKEVAVQRVAVKRVVDYEGTYVWWLKEVSFAPGQTVRIRNEYEIRYSENVEGTRWFTYILVTGAGWKGSIGEATVTVDLGRIPPGALFGPGVPQQRPGLAVTPGFRLAGRQLQWRFLNFEPTERNNIRVAWVGAIADPTRLCPQCSTRPLTEADLRGKSARTLTLMRNEIYAVHGRMFQRKDLDEYFRRQTWYRPNPTFQESWLSAVEHRNAEFILAYQIKHGMPR